MKNRATILLLFLWSYGFSQSVGGGGICHVNGDPNLITDLDDRNYSFHCTIAFDTLNNVHYYYDKSLPVGSRWKLNTGDTNLVSNDLEAFEDRYHNFKDFNLVIDSLEVLDLRGRNKSIFRGILPYSIPGGGSYYVGSRADISTSTKALSGILTGNTDNGTPEVIAHSETSTYQGSSFIERNRFNFFTQRKSDNDTKVQIIGFAGFTPSSSVLSFSSPNYEFADSNYPSIDNTQDALLAYDDQTGTWYTREASSLGGGGGDTDKNFAEDDLNADGNRYHNFKSHTLKIDSIQDIELYVMDSMRMFSDKDGIGYAGISDLNDVIGFESIADNGDKTFNGVTKIGNNSRGYIATTNPTNDDYSLIQCTKNGLVLLALENTATTSSRIELSNDPVDAQLDIRANTYRFHQDPGNVWLPEDDDNAPNLLGYTEDGEWRTVSSSFLSGKKEYIGEYSSSSFSQSTPWLLDTTSGTASFSLPATWSGETGDGITYMNKSTITKTVTGDIDNTSSSSLIVNAGSTVQFYWDETNATWWRK